MRWLDTVLILGVALLAVCWETAFWGPRRLLGAQIHLLPSLMVYTALRGSFRGIAVLGLGGGLLFDSLSANPLGVSVLPLLAAGVGIYLRRELILQSQVFAQVVLGMAASIVVPSLTILLLLTLRESPMLGWGTLWQLTVAGVAGAFAAPGFFILFEWMDRTFMYSASGQSSFRADREIRRGR